MCTTMQRAVLAVACGMQRGNVSVACLSCGASGMSSDEHTKAVCACDPLSLIAPALHATRPLLATVRSVNASAQKLRPIVGPATWLSAPTPRTLRLHPTTVSPTLVLLPPTAPTSAASQPPETTQPSSHSTASVHAPPYSPLSLCASISTYDVRRPHASRDLRRHGKRGSHRTLGGHKP